MDANRNETSPGKLQFSLSTLILAMLFAAALATVTVNLAGTNWNALQITAAYLVTIGFVVGFAVVSHARARIVAYLLLAPLVFVSSVSAAALFRSHAHYAPTPVTRPVTTFVFTPRSN